MALTSDQARAVEDRAVAAGTTLGALMRSAGAAVAAEVHSRFPLADVAVVAGGGNNGGDGWVAAAELLAMGHSVRVYSVKDPVSLSGIAGDAASDAIAAGVQWTVPADGPSAETLQDVDVVIDALLGTGSAPPLRGSVRAWCEAINSSDAYVVSVDLPSGIDPDTGQRDEAAVMADCTVTFMQPKLGLVTYPAAAHAGQVMVASIGEPVSAVEGLDAPIVLTAREYAAMLREPAPDAHKNSRGRVLVIAGSTRFPGAAVLCARGAMRMGAGYVTVAVPKPVVPVIQSHLAAAPVVGLPASRTGGFTADAAAAALELADEYDAVVIGPGLTLADGAVATVRRLVEELRGPLVIDADGLNALIDAVDIAARRTQPTVLTPHPGELARLLGHSVSDVQSDRVSSSAELAGNGMVVVLKGAGTVVSAGERSIVVTSGSPALATAGTGDVLAGMIGALLAQGLDALDAAALGAYVHGRAGEAAAEELTPVCVTAEDLPQYLPVAVAELMDHR